MRLTHFWTMAEHLFGPGLARTYAGQTVLPGVGHRTALEAIEDGVPVRDAWAALCDEMDVPDGLRWEVEPGVSVRGGGD